MLAGPPLRRGPLTIQEARALRRFLLRPATLESFAAFGADCLLSCLDVPRAFGATLPGATRRTWWLRLVDLGATLNTLSDPAAPAMRTAESRNRQAHEAGRALAAFAAYHEARVVPRVAELPPPSWHRAEPPPDDDAGSRVVPFRRRESVHAPSSDDSDGTPPPAAA